ncbi:carbon-nitrogen hydrolase family protein [Nesterenkonia sp. HG001]|uniref:carbon-nitrogen hydrolase family protein n=1 Tax=Nesterenkonia sp. HG001 TaxID=2983207 RepID=UPI002AC77007|nr:carbon-nitrogen hydrolase family protein [Nesterenkonia sp. HG001]MDZ5077671.1 carbon-nitrogen hydrolase family protein [Nesterenkonia sp. HG001]
MMVITSTFREDLETLMDINYTRTVRAAVVQQEPVWLDLEGAVEKTVELIREAADHGAEIIAFPETWIPNYPWWIWLDSVAWQSQFTVPYAANSLTVEGREMRAIQDAARRSGIVVGLGYSERDAGSLYMGQAVIEADGTLVSARRKLKPTHVERTVFGEGDGSDLIVTETSLGRIGSLCCWEHLQPLSKYALFSQHEQIHIASWPSFSIFPGAVYALGPEVNTAASQQYAVEGQTFVLAASAVVGEAGLRIFADTEEKRGLIHPGGGYARIFAPDGRMLAEPLAPDEEGILYADLDLSAILAAKNAADPVGHYSRPDVLQLRFNDQQQPRVTRGGHREDPQILPPESGLQEAEQEKASDAGAVE